MGWGPDEIRSFRELVEAGLSNAVIAVGMDPSEAAVLSLRMKQFPESFKRGDRRSVPGLPKRSTPVGGAPSDWKPERVERLKELHRQGMTAAQIAADLGGLSRSAVIGKIHRLKISGDAPPKPAPKKAALPPRERPAKPTPAPKPAKPAMQIPAAEAVEIDDEQEDDRTLRARFDRAFTATAPDGSAGVAVVDGVKIEQCRWPIGPIDGPATTHFCGQPVAQEGMTRVYCALHRRLAYQPAGRTGTRNKSAIANALARQRVRQQRETLAASFRRGA